MKGVLNARLFYIRDDICIVILIPEFALHAFFNERIHSICRNTTMNSLNSERSGKKQENQANVITIP